MPLTDKQREYLMKANHRWNVKTGATGSGKSFLDFTILIPKRLELLRGEGLAVMIGNTQGTLNRNIFEPMREWWPGLVSEIHSDNTIDIFGHKCYALGADSKKHVARIQGATFEYVYGDEVTTWSEDVFSMLKSRLRCPHSRFDGTCNPDNPNHWFKKFLDSDADIYHQHYHIDDGALDPKIIAQLKQEYAGTVYYERFIKGNWAAAEGAIYTPWCDKSSRFIRSVKRSEICRSIIGVDFGGSGSATAFVCVGILNGYIGAAVLREYYHKGVVTPTKQEERFVDFAKQCMTDFGTMEVYCDSAEQTLIEGFRMAALKAGLALDILNARKGEIINRIRFVVRLMGRGAFFVDPLCKHVQEALTSAVYSGKTPGKDERLDDGSTNIDSLDAMEYALEPVMNDMMMMG